MTNYDRIKQMTLTELSYFLSEYDSHCNFCIYNNSIGCISNQYKKMVGKRDVNL